MTKDELMKRMRTLKDPLATRVMCVLLAMTPNAAEREARPVLLALALGCSEAELGGAFRKLASVGLGELVETRWLQ